MITLLLTGHSNRGSAYDTCDSCGTCNGANCDYCRSEYTVEVPKDFAEIYVFSSEEKAKELEKFLEL